MNFDWKKVQESKEAMRQSLADLPIAEKLRMLDELRERELAIRRATGRGDVTMVREEPGEYGNSSGEAQE